MVIVFACGQKQYVNTCPTGSEFKVIEINSRHYWKKEGCMRDDTVQVGEWKTYYSSGELRRTINYNRKGELHGVDVGYGLDGGVGDFGNYVNGKPHGPSIMFLENGQINFLTTYLNGKLNGLDVSYDEEGEEMTKNLWKDGVKIDSINGL